MVAAARSEVHKGPEHWRAILVQRGYHEAITYSFVDPALQAVLCPGEPTLRLANPISADLAEMRTSLWPGLVRALLENQRRQQPRVRLFELGRKFRLEGSTLHEVPVLAGIAAGPVLGEQWGAPSSEREKADNRSADLAHGQKGRPTCILSLTVGWTCSCPTARDRVWTFMLSAIPSL